MDQRLSFTEARLKELGGESHSNGGTSSITNGGTKSNGAKPASSRQSSGGIGKLQNGMGKLSMS